MGNRWRELFDFLEGKGYDVYSPSQKTGDCTSAYLVISQSQSMKYLDLSTDIVYYDIYINVPLKRYTQMLDMKSKLKNDLKELYPKFKDTRNDSVTIVDDSIKAHVAKVTYSNYIKVNNI